MLVRCEGVRISIWEILGQNLNGERVIEIFEGIPNKINIVRMTRASSRLFGFSTHIVFTNRIQTGCKVRLTHVFLWQVFFTNCGDSSEFHSLRITKSEAFRQTPIECTKRPRNMHRSAYPMDIVHEHRPSSMVWRRLPILLVIMNSVRQLIIHLTCV